MSKELSAITNGGISGVKTVDRQNVDCFVDFNDVVPGQYGFDSDEGFTQYRIRPPKQEGHIVAYQISGFDTCTLYCGVTVDGELTWAPVLIYGEMVNRSTGATL